MKKGKFITILCFIFTLLLCPFSLFAEESEHGEVIIQTDGTYYDHEVIQACEVGDIVKLDIGSFDTAYVDNNFDVNRNIDGYIMFVCQQTNDIKLAYYGINQTVFYPLEDITLTQVQYDYLKNLDYNTPDLYIEKWAGGNYLFISFDVSNYNASTARVNYSGYTILNADGSLEQGSDSGTTSLDPANKHVLFLKQDNVIYYDGFDLAFFSGSIDPYVAGASLSGFGYCYPGIYQTLSVNLPDGYVLDHWSNGETTDSISVLAEGTKTFVAYVVPQSVTTTYTVSASVSPEGYGYVDGAGTYTSGSLVTLSAHANEGYRFKEWNTGSTSNYLTFNINENRNYIAYFEVDPNYTPPEEETITVSGSVSPINSGYIQGLGEYEPGADVTLTAVANDGYTFVQWDNGNTSPTRILNSMSDINVIAYFVSNNSTSSNILFEEQDILLDYICDSTNSYTYRHRVRTIKAPNMNVYASLSNSDNYQLIAKDVNEFVISGISSIKTSGSCYFQPYIQDSETSFLSDGAVISSDDGYVSYKFVLTEKSDPIVDGTTESNIATDKNDEQNAELDSVINEYNEIEGQFKDNLDTSLNDIDFSFDFGNITDFSTSANFVRTQFDNLTNNPFGSLVGFSLAVGLALLIMGRRL